MSLYIICPIVFMYTLNNMVIPSYGHSTSIFLELQLITTVKSFTWPQHCINSALICHTCTSCEPEVRYRNSIGVFHLPHARSSMNLLKTTKRHARTELFKVFVNTTLIQCYNIMICVCIFLNGSIGIRLIACLVMRTFEQIILRGPGVRFYLKSWCQYLYSLHNR